MSQLSIIIVASSTDAALESTVTSVLEHQPAGAEIFVAHDGSYEDPYDLGDEVQFIIVPGAVSWMQLANAAASEVTTPYMHFLAAGVEVDRDWTAAAVKKLEEHGIASVCPVILDAAGIDRVLTAGQTWTAGGGVKLVAAGLASGSKALSRCRADGATQVAGFFASNAWRDAGGYDETTGTDLAAIDLALRMRAAGGKCEVEPQSCVFAPADTLVGPLSGAENVYQRERIYRRHATGSRLWHSIATVTDLLRWRSAYLQAWREEPTSIHNSFAEAGETADVIPMPANIATTGLRRAA